MPCRAGVGVFAGSPSWHAAQRAPAPVCGPCTSSATPWPPMTTGGCSVAQRGAVCTKRDSGVSVRIGEGNAGTLAKHKRVGRQQNASAPCAGPHTLTTTVFRAPWPSALPHPRPSRCLVLHVHHHRASMCDLVRHGVPAGCDCDYGCRCSSGAAVTPPSCLSAPHECDCATRAVCEGSGRLGASHACSRRSSSTPHARLCWSPRETAWLTRRRQRMMTMMRRQLVWLRRPGVSQRRRAVERLRRA